MRAIVTGVSGFLGRHVADRLVSLGANVHGIARHPNSRTLPQVQLYSGDLIERHFANDLVRGVQPDMIVHLAASKVVQSDASTLIRENVSAAANLLEAASDVRPIPRVVIASSSLVYGTVGGRLNECIPLSPATPYAASKAAVEMIAIAYKECRNLPVLRARLFNLIGPGQRDGVAADLAARILDESQDSLGTGTFNLANAHHQRDFVDVRDAANAIVALADRGPVGSAFNVGSGSSRSVLECAQRLAEAAGVKVRVLPTSVPDTFVPCTADISAIAASVGWRPTISFATSIADLVATMRGGKENGQS